jgi:hypothetical protein
MTCERDVVLLGWPLSPLTLLTSNANTGSENEGRERNRQNHKVRRARCTALTRATLSGAYEKSLTFHYRFGNRH